MSDPRTPAPGWDGEADFPIRTPASSAADTADTVPEVLIRTRVDRIRMAGLDVSPRTRAMLREVGLWDDERVLDVSAKAFESMLREAEVHPEPRGR